MQANAEQQPHKSHLFYISELNETEIAWQLSHVKAEIAGLHLTKASTVCSTGRAGIPLLLPWGGLLQTAANCSSAPILPENNTPGSHTLSSWRSPAFSKILKCHVLCVENGLGWKGDQVQELHSLWFHQDVGTENLLLE